MANNNSSLAGIVVFLPLLSSVMNGSLSSLTKGLLSIGLQIRLLLVLIFVLFCLYFATPLNLF